MNFSSPKTIKACAQTENEKILKDLTLIFQNVKTKADLIKAIAHEEVLRRIPIEHAPSVSKEQAEKDFRRERVILNGVFFIPDKVDMVRCEAFALSLHHLVQRLQLQEGKSTPSSSSSSRSNDISDTILQRGCRTSAGADSFFMVQKLLCVEGTFVTQKTSLRSEDPIIVDVFYAHDETDLDPDLNYLDPDLTVENMRALEHSDSFTNSITSCLQCTEQESERETDVIMNQNGVGMNINNENSSKNTISSHSLNGNNSSRNNDNIDNSNKNNDNDNLISTITDVENIENIEHGNGIVKGTDTTHTVTNSTRTPCTTRNTSTTGSMGGGSLFTRIEVKNFFSVYDISAMDFLPSAPEMGVFDSGCGGMGGGGGGVSSSKSTYSEPTPWLEVETILIDESNFNTNEHWRRIQLVVTEMIEPSNTS